MRPSFFHHLHPPTIPAKQARWRYTLAAGGIAVLLTLIVGITGILEMFYYIPTPEKATLSVQTISYLVPFGWLIRNLHYWSAQLLMLIAGIHLLRVVFTGAYRQPRRLNYLLGLGIFVLMLLLDFTGYMLRWDQGIQWALVVGTNLLKSIPYLGAVLHAAATGGISLGSSALIRFYSWHTFGLTTGVIILGAWHLFRIRRDGGIAVPPPALRTDHNRISRYELVRREVLAALITAAVLLLLAIFRPAPIAAPMSDPATYTKDARAPWFFLWVQQMLKLGDPFLYGILIPVILLTMLALIPYVLPSPEPAELGRWFPPSSRLAQVLVGLMVLGVLALTLLMLFQGQ